MIKGLSVGSWSSGASINMVDLNEKRMTNLEAHMDAVGTYALPMGDGSNYSHMNMYKELEVQMGGALGAIWVRSGWVSPRSRH